MPTARQLLLIVANVLIASACHDSSQTPSDRVESPASEPESPEGILNKPVDLVYVCGNKFLATNSSLAPIRVTYRVVGSAETDTLILPPGEADDPGHSETELQTVKRGAVELYHGEERVAYRRNRGLLCGPSASSASVAALADPASSGQWTQPFPWPMIGIHLILLPNGNILTWGDGGDAAVWHTVPMGGDPSSGSFTMVGKTAEIFCGGMAFLPDGRLLVAGGKHDFGGMTGLGNAETSIFNPATSSFSRSFPMRIGRWYPTVTTLPSGDMLLLSGNDANGDVNPVPEVWTPGGIRVLSGASRRLPNYPRAFVAPNGQLYYAGQQQQTRFLDPNGSGSWTTASKRLFGLRDYGAAVMYERGKILYAGGGRTTNTAEIVDLNRSTQWSWTGSMAFQRRHLNLTVLPTGDVLAVGGTTGTNFNDKDLAVHPAEIWSPGTGIWTVVASNTAPRTYHSTTILLPDGRILSAGAVEVGVRTAELYSPPYLFKGSRPTITDAPGQIAYGASFAVTTPDAADIAKVSLIRLGATTHAFDENQRFLGLQFTSGAGALTITAPGSRNDAPPGHYMVFILNSNGVPSVARIVKLGTASDPTPVNAAPHAEFTPECTDLTCTFTDHSTDSDGTVQSWSWNFGDGSTADGAAQTHSFATSGSYNVTETVTDDDNATGTVTHQVTVPPQSANSAPNASYTQSCTGLNCTFTDLSTDSDGTVTGWLWTFGDGTSSTNRNPSHTYASAGSRKVTLRATDNAGAFTEDYIFVNVTTSTQIVLRLTPAVTATAQTVTLNWTGATGTTVDVYRGGTLLRQEPNDGEYTNSRPLPGVSQVKFKICQAGTTVCSNEASVVF